MAVASPTRMVIDLESNDVAQALAGDHDAHLKILERRLDCLLTLRGNVLILEGQDEGVAKARAALDELLTVIRSRRPVNSPASGRRSAGSSGSSVPTTWASVPTSVN